MIIILLINYIGIQEVEGVLDDICRKIKKFRESSGYTQKQVSNLLNIERSTYSYYEIGKTIPDLKTLLKLAEIFKKPLMSLLEDERSGMNFADSPQFNQDHEDLKEKNKKYSKYKQSITKISEIKSKKCNPKRFCKNEYPKFLTDLTTQEKDIIICFRMLSYTSQKEIKEIIEKYLKVENILI